MADCSSITLSGLGLSCADGFGGIKEVYIAQFGDVASITEADGVVSAIAMESGKKFKHYKFRKATGSLTSTMSKDDAAGSQLCQSDLALQFNKYADSAVRLEISQLAIGNLRVIVKTNEGTFVLLGANNEVTATAVGGQTGQAYTDGSFYNITLSDMDKDFPPIVNSDVITDTIIDFQ